MSLSRQNRNHKNASAFQRSTARWLATWVCVWLFVLSPMLCNGQQITFPRPDLSSSISVSSTQVSRWKRGQYEILHLYGDVRIKQQNITAASNEAILWVETPDGSLGKQYKIIAYMEGQVTIDMARVGEAHPAIDRSPFDPKKLIDTTSVLLARCSAPKRKGNSNTPRGLGGSVRTFVRGTDFRRATEPLHLEDGIPFSVVRGYSCC